MATDHTDHALKQMKRVLLEVVLIVTAFCAGYVSCQLRAGDTLRSCQEDNQRLQSRLQDIETEFRVATLNTELGMILVEVEENNFGLARQRSTRFFDRLRDTIPVLQDPVQVDRLRALLSQRDEVNADLITANQETAAKLRMLYAANAGSGARGPAAK